jgi:hypothetical protein
LDLDQDGEMEFIERNLMKRWITGMLVKQILQG